MTNKSKEPYLIGTTIKYKFEINVNRCVDDTIEKTIITEKKILI